MRKVAILSISLSLLAISFAFMNYYGQVFEPSPILNTNMKFWTFDPAKNTTRPYLWEIDIIKGNFDNVSVFQAETDNRPAIGLKVYRSTQNSTSVWTTIHVRQDLRGKGLDAIFRSSISLWVYPTFPYWYGQESENPENAFGIEINDGTNLIWFIFSDAPSETFQLPRHRIVLIQTPLNTWSLRQVDIAKQYDEAGWKLPQSLSFILILGTTWLHPGTWVGYFSGMTVDVAPLQTESLSLSQSLMLLTGDALVILALIIVSALLQRREKKTALNGAPRPRARKSER